MARDINANALAQVVDRIATEPLIIIEVQWGLQGPIAEYCDRNYQSIPGKIISVSGLDAVIKLGSTGAVGSLSVTLDDADGTIKTIMNTNDVHKGRVRVYQGYGSLASSDRFLLLLGEINSPIVWDQAAKTVSFEVVTFIEDREIGFSPEEGDLEFLAPSAVGVAWPLCFGKPVRVPAVKLTERTRGTSLTRYSLITVSNLLTLCGRAEAVARTQRAKDLADQDQGFSDDNYGSVIANYCGALTSMNIYIGTLVLKAPSKAGGLRAYANNCVALAAAESELEFQFAAQVEFENAAIANQEAINGLQQELFAAQNANPIDPAQIDSINQQLAAQQSELASNNTNASIAENRADAARNSIVTLTAVLAGQETALAQFDIGQIVVEGGENFPQNQQIQIMIKQVKFAGQFNGKVFTVSFPNVPYLPGNGGNASPGNNGSSGVGAVLGNENQISIPGGSQAQGFYNLTGQGLTFIDSQIGNIAFVSPVLFQQTGQLAPVPNLLVNGQPVVREIYDPVNPGLGTTAPLLPVNWVNNLRSGSKPTWANGVDKVSDKNWDLEFGDTVYLDGDYQDIYVANLIPSNQVFEVVGRRNLDGRDVIVPVPSSYYSINLNDNLAGQNPTTITFNRPLDSFLNQGWSGDVYVTLESSEGPNTSDIIKYLVDTYTDFTTDPTSFGSVQTDLDPFPSNFALLERVPALQTIENIAWQARCAAFLSNEVVKIRFLAKDEVAEDTITLDEIESRTLNLTFTPTEDLVTKWVANWTEDYSRRDLFPDEQNRVILRNNIPRYGEIEEEYDIYIYNSEVLVEQTAFYWMVRYSSTWKRLSFTCFLDKLALEQFDPITIDFATDVVANGPVKARVEAVTYDSDNQSLQFEVWVSVRAGEMASYVFAYPFSADPSLTYPTEDDPFAGGGSSAN